MSKFKLYRTNPDSPSIDLDSHIQEIKNLETAINAPEQIDYIENNKAQLTTACQRYAMDLVFELGRIVRINDRLMQEDILSAQSSPSEKKSAFQSLKEKLAPLDEQAQKLLKTQANYLETTARIKQQYHIITGRTRLQEYNRNFSTLSRTIDETRKKIGRDETILDASISREHLAEYEGKLGKIDKKDEVEFSSSDKLGEKKTGLKDSDVPMLETAIQNREKFIAGLADWRKKVSDIQTIIQKELDNALKTEKDLVTYRISGNAGSGGFKTLQATIALMQNNADISQGLAKQEIYEKTAQKDTIVAAAASREKMTQHEKDLNAIPQMNQTQFSALTKAGAKNKRTSTTSVYEDDIKTYTKAIEEREAFLKKLPDYLKQLSALEEAIETNARNAIIIQTNIEKYALGVTAGTVEAEALKKRITSLKETAQKDKQDITNELPDYRKTLNQKKLRQEEETLMASIDNEVTQIQSLRQLIDKKIEPKRFLDMLTPEHKKLSTLNKEAEILKEALKKVDEKPNIDKTGTDAEKKT